VTPYQLSLVDILPRGSPAAASQSTVSAPRGTEKQDVWGIQRMKAGDRAIHEFQGVYRFLSNFWPATVVLDDIEYPTVEHAYQAAKTLDPHWRHVIWSARTPGIAKRIGKELGPSMRPDWRSIRVRIMDGLLHQKFSAGSPLAQQLIETFPHWLIEGNTWGDTFWGKCRGVGANQLGTLLMHIRAELMGLTNE
jgi:ribA/ribD-fused uncharacterized protein